ncbi:MAG: hypothetical protein HN348_29790, partial [Proteobacteria bacterium]|nr:hypothetical protein [Pseudomonadota bacterium]
MSIVLDDFAQRRRRGAAILHELADIAEAQGAEQGVRQLRALARRAMEGRFVLLLLGCFSSGKSTLLNALLGRPALPVKVNPCTAILTEVVYGETPSVDIHYDDGQTRKLDIDSFLEEFQLRTAMQDAGAEAADRFGNVERAVLAYPLPLLKNGVVILDTPGLDDDDRRTARTLSSLPDADAVIVVLNATRFLTDLERRTLRRNLLPLGLCNLFFPVTMVDLLEALSDDPEGELADIYARGHQDLAPLCEVEGNDLFQQRFFPLDSRGALFARYDNATKETRETPDTKKLEESGILAFEQSLERFLVQDRGQAELRHLVSVANRVNNDLVRQAELDRATASSSVEELRHRQTELEPRFDELTAIAQRVERTVDHFIGRQQHLIWQDLRDFVIAMEQEIPSA